MDCSLPRAPRRAQTGHGSLSSYNAVPQTWHARLVFVLTPPPSNRELNRFGLQWLAQNPDRRLLVAVELSQMGSSRGYHYWPAIGIWGSLSSRDQPAIHRPRNLHLSPSGFSPLGRVQGLMFPTGNGTATHGA